MITTWSNILRYGLLAANWVAVFYFFLLNSVYLLLLICAARQLRRRLLSAWQQTDWRILGSKAAPRISLLAPAYNEMATIAESVRAFLSLEYPNLEVLVINDGSSDDTLAVLQQQFELVAIHPIYRRQLRTKAVRRLFRSRSHPNLVVADKENGGKADALNAGLNLATGDLVCVVDADTLIQADSLKRMVRPFLLRPDVTAAGGTIRVANGSTVDRGRVSLPRVPRNFLAGIQVVEYLRAFLFGRLGWNSLGGNLIVSGGFGVFRRDDVVRTGGYKADTVGEDLELVLNLRRLGRERQTACRVEFVPDPVAWTEVPQNLVTLGRQRDRWHRGLAQVLWRYRQVIFRLRYGALGLIACPAFVLEVVAPVFEAFGLIFLAVAILLGVVNWPFALLFWLAAYGYGLMLSLTALVLEEVSYRRYSGLGDRALLLAYALLENYGYRQLTVFWRLRGLLKLVQGKTEWGPMERRGFAPHPEEDKRAAVGKGGA